MRAGAGADVAVPADPSRPRSRLSHQVVAASCAEDEFQKKVALTRFSAPEARALRGSPEAEGAAAALDAAAAAVSRHRGLTLSASQLLGRANGSLARERARMAASLRAAPRADLNVILPTVNLAALLEAGGAAVTDILAHDRLPDLGVLARAALVDALQKVGLRHRPRRQAAAARVLLDTKGLDLTRVKALLDDGGDHHSFFRLCCFDLQGAARGAVLSHAAAEGAAVAASFAAAVPAGPPGVLLKVVCDIDDTLVCSGGRVPAGVDARLPRGCAYPGAAAFLNELDAGHAERVADALDAASAGGERERGRTPRAGDRDDDRAARAARGATARLRATLLGPWDADFEAAVRHRAARAAGSGPPPPPPRGLHQRGGSLVFLSARPETPSGFTEASSFRSIFAPLLAAARLHRAPVLLLGSLRAGPRALAARLTRAAGPRAAAAPADLATQLWVSLYRKKLDAWTSYAALYPEACFVFVGDNGQGDVLLAEELHRRSAAAAAARARGAGRATTGAPPPAALLACFIHRVAPVTKTLSALRCAKANRAAWLAAWRGEGIYAFKSHVGMAVQAATLGLISHDGLRRVCLEAVWDVRAAVARYGATGADWARAAREINADLAAAAELLQDASPVPVVRVGGDDGADAAAAGGERARGGSPRARSPPPGPQLPSRHATPPPGPRPPSRHATPPPSPPPRGGLLAPAAAGGVSPPWSPLAGGSPLGTSPLSGGAWPPAWAGLGPGAMRGRARGGSASPRGASPEPRGASPEPQRADRASPGPATPGGASPAPEPGDKVASPPPRMPSLAQGLGGGGA